MVTPVTSERTARSSRWRFQIARRSPSGFIGQLGLVGGFLNCPVARRWLNDKFGTRERAGKTSVLGVCGTRCVTTLLFYCGEPTFILSNRVNILLFVVVVVRFLIDLPYSVSERFLEDHEYVLSASRDMRGYSRHAQYRYVFRKDYRKYEFFHDPQVSIVVPERVRWTFLFVRSR